MKGRERGIALVLVLWIVAILSVLAAGFAQVTRLEALRVANGVAAAEARALLDEGLAHTLLHLKASDEAARWRPDGTTRTLTTPGGTVTARMTDESGKVDLNAAPEATLRALFRAQTPDGDRLAKAVREAREQQRPFLAVAELAALEGVDPAAWARLKPLVTVYGGERINAATADPAVLEALSGVPTAVLLARRGDPAWRPEARLIGGLDYMPAGGPVLSVQLEAVTPEGARASAEVVLWMATPIRRLAWTEPAGSW